MDSRPFRLYGATTERKVLEHARNVLQEWLASWLSQSLSSANLDVSVQEVKAAPVENWCYLASDVEHQLGFHVEDSWIPGIATLLYGVSQDESCNTHTDGLAQKLLDAMLAELAARFLGMSASGKLWSLTATTTTIGDEAKEPGAGFMAIRIHVASNFQMWLLMSPQYIESMEGTASQQRKSCAILTPPIQAIGDRYVTLSLELGAGEVTIEELGSLAVGDVIPLDHNLNDEFIVRINGGGPVCHGFMGTSNGKIAVQLLSKS